MEKKTKPEEQVTAKKVLQTLAARMTNIISVFPVLCLATSEKKLSLSKLQI